MDVETTLCAYWERVYCIYIVIVWLRVCNIRCIFDCRDFPTIFFKTLDEKNILGKFLTRKNNFSRLRLGSVFQVALPLVGTAEPKTMPFSKIQGRLEPTWPTSVSDLHPHCKRVKNMTLRYAIFQADTLIFLQKKLFWSYVFFDW